MRWFLITCFLFIFSIGFAQSLDSIKHVEVVSEIQDTMALINKTDVDKINKVFHDYRILDSLDKVNSKIIETLEIKNDTLSSILLEQKAVVQNQKNIVSELKKQLDSKISQYESTIIKEQRKRGWGQSATAVSLITIIIILLV